LPNYHVSNVKDRPASPSVKQLVRQYYHNRDRERNQKEVEEIKKSLPDFQEENEENQVVSEEEQLALNDEEEIARIKSDSGSLTSQSMADNRSYQKSSSSMSNNQAVIFKLEAKKTDEFYAKNTRPRTVPHEIFHDESIKQEIEMLAAQRSAAAAEEAAKAMENARGIVSAESHLSTSKMSKYPDDSKSEGTFTYMNEAPDDEEDDDDDIINENVSTTDVTSEKKSAKKTESAQDREVDNKDDNDDVVVATRSATNLSGNAENVEIKDDDRNSEDGSDEEKAELERKKSAQKPPKDKLEKALSDIYPVNNKNAVMSEAHDLRYEMKARKDYSNAEDMRLEHENAIANAKLEEHELKIELEKKKNEKAMAKLAVNNSQGVQVTSYDLNKYVRKVMDNQKLAKRLEYSEMLAERLVTSALLAGSDENITVNCILLPGCNHF
jgi:hypothetical protein